jgi:hypothetical protein
MGCCQFNAMVAQLLREASLAINSRDDKWSRVLQDAASVDFRRCRAQSSSLKTAYPFSLSLIQAVITSYN